MVLYFPVMDGSLDEPVEKRRPLPSVEIGSVHHRGAANVTLAANLTAFSGYTYEPILVLVERELHSLARLFILSQLLCLALLRRVLLGIDLGLKHPLLFGSTLLLLFSLLLSLCLSSLLLNFALLLRLSLSFFFILFNVNIASC